MADEDIGEGRLRTLTSYDCWSLLEEGEVARVAWVAPAGAAVVPVNYTVADGSMWFRIDPSSALGREVPGQRVAVEVDHIDPGHRAGWSVVVIGTAEVVPLPDVPESVDLRVWPSGPRSAFVRVVPAEVTGRRLFGRR
jgi:nitroimidazol reductase NimA-like FMN-containing flavoprotein (pyridoxamine 5'-phosphate oxidase superfamily)